MYFCPNEQRKNMKTLQDLAHLLAEKGKEVQRPLTEEEYLQVFQENCDQCTPTSLTTHTFVPTFDGVGIEERPTTLECDVVRFQNKKEKWVAFVGLMDGMPYEIFTGLMDDDEGIVLPKSVTKGRIIKAKNADGTHRYDFQFENKRGYKTTVEGLSGKFNKEYWNYAKLISGVLRYHMPLESVIHLVSSLSLDDESINTWKIGVERALKKYVQTDFEDGNDNED